MVERSFIPDGFAKARALICSATVAAVRGERPPATRRLGLRISWSSRMMDVLESDIMDRGGDSMIIWPLAPPMPEPQIATRDFPDDAAHGRGVFSVGTRIWYLSHSINGFLRERLTFAGMIRVAKMLITLVREARNAAISVWL